MNCKKCGAKLMDGAKFCMICGAKAGLSCPKCGTELPDVAKFCFKCGTEVKPSVNKQVSIPRPILDEETMSELAEIKKQETKAKSFGAPVWDQTPQGTCDCAIGECDCDGSIWS